MMSKNSIDKNEISSKILQYGSDILNSDAFRKCIRSMYASCAYG